jgi:hypothetical protein
MGNKATKQSSIGTLPFQTHLQAIIYTTFVAYQSNSSPFQYERFQDLLKQAKIQHLGYFLELQRDREGRGTKPSKEDETFDALCAHVQTFLADNLLVQLDQGRADRATEEESVG